MTLTHFEKSDYWRALILYGLNAATYKIALGHCLIDLSNQGKTNVTMNELAVVFFDLYHERLKNNKPQLNMPKRRTVMEKIVDLHNMGKLSRAAAIERVENEAFNDVISRFHNIGNISIPKFYEQTPNGIVLTDNLFEVFTSEKGEMLSQELLSRWDLLEAAFEIKRENNELINDVRKFYLSKGYERTSVTHTIPVLNGYQQDVCFYCGEHMHKDIHVDHVIPRQFINHDEIWNLALAHGLCNERKSDYLPGIDYIEKLIERNEHFIKSNHPISNKLIAKLGNTPTRRRKYVMTVFEDARFVLGGTWEGIMGYNPSTDIFYKTFIRGVRM